MNDPPAGDRVGARQGRRVPVLDRNYGAVLIEDGLMATLDVDDRQAADAQANSRGLDTSRDRSDLGGHHVGHAVEQHLQDGLASIPAHLNDAADSTSSLPPAIQGIAARQPWPLPMPDRRNR
jgi:hypothetical protein